VKSAQLFAHHGVADAEVDGIEVAVDRGPGGVLTLSYVVTGRISDLRIPARAAPMRTDELWKHTCFEAFLRAPGSEAYVEFNLAPSSQWAAYAFTGYRERAPDPPTPAPFIDADGGRTRLELRASVDVAAMPGLPADAPWRAALSAVIESANGRRSYWALAHPPGLPDFHHADSFALTLPPPNRA
jgi:hypothetical protein